MKSKFSFALPAAVVLAAATLTACVTNPAAQAQHAQHHPDTAQSQGRKGMGGDSMGNGMMMSDAEMKSMCDMHMKMMRTKTSEERKAMMAEHMKTMSPQMKQHHMEMMQMMKEHMGT